MLEPWRHVERRKSRQIMVGDLAVSGDAPIAVQSAANTPSDDAAATIAQVKDLEEAGAVLFASCPDEAATKALKEIVDAAHVPIVADIHFHYRRAIEAEARQRVCALILAILVMISASAKWWRRLKPMAVPCALASMPGRGKTFARAIWRAVPRCNG